MGNVTGASANTYQPPLQSPGGGENEDLKQERKAAARESLKESIESFKITEKKKNIDAIR
ncbi:type III secretion effector protein [Pseudomonas synxantha]|uniref:Type III secretion effector protein n=2 Tax=Pseudomonas fluorescens group TaxID=136843 RepID=A0ABR5M364_9PSED|nr:MULTISPECIES: hypothetical protein [Pseudomonas]AKA84304.1 hypothetical protein VO64_3758 [Pseudomonas synxantha]AMS20100.1 type III secretion effector protein [Pseudomonas synxantha]KPG72626.1 type III secretion effector protein [Pseudomonas libanensis]KRA27739.1 type III secretion effector protein [Pseudomonas sp. Root569]MDT3232613.1 type III secretion effector protein [Pseudomonas sp. rhizo25]